MEIIDPTDEEVCASYGRFRRSLDTSEADWTMERTQRESYTTIVACCWYRQRFELLDVRIGLSRVMPTLRWDLSASSLVITQGDPRKPALLVEHGKPLYDYLYTELSKSLEQARPVPALCRRSLTEVAEGRRELRAVRHPRRVDRRLLARGGRQPVRAGGAGGAPDRGEPDPVRGGLLNRRTRLGPGRVTAAFRPWSHLRRGCPASTGQNRSMAGRRGGSRVDVQRWVVAVDGPSGSGKSTISRRLARQLGARYLDTGAMYRAVTWAVLEAGMDPHDAEAVAKVAAEVALAVGTDPTVPAVSVDGHPVETEIRGPAVTRAVSAVAAVPEVRRLLVARQREIIAKADRIVVEGRDIGAVVAPDADLKVYLTASAVERARRRSAEQDADLAATVEDLARRDRLDSTRATDPLRRAPGAVELDTTTLGIDQVVVRLVAMMADRRRAAE